MLANADKVKRAAYREGLTAHADAAILSKRLVTLRTDVPVTLDLEALRRRPPDRAAAHALFTELEFVALAKEFAPEAGPSRTDAPRAVVAGGDRGARWREARKAGQVALCFVRDAREPMRAQPARRRPGLAARGRRCTCRSRTRRWRTRARRRRRRSSRCSSPLLEDTEVRKLSARGKHDRILLCRQGLGCEGLAFDALVASYLLNPGRGNYTHRRPRDGVPGRAPARHRRRSSRAAGRRRR